MRTAGFLTCAALSACCGASSDPVTLAFPLALATTTAASSSDFTSACQTLQLAANARECLCSWGQPGGPLDGEDAGPFTDCNDDWLSLPAGYDGGNCAALSTAALAGQTLYPSGAPDSCAFTSGSAADIPNAAEPTDGGPGVTCTWDIQTSSCPGISGFYW